jgi:hypothetical protein
VGVSPGMGAQVGRIFKAVILSTGCLGTVPEHLGRRSVREMAPATAADGCHRRKGKTMAVDRATRNELADAIEQWLQGKMATTAVSEKVWEIAKRTDDKGRQQDRLLQHVVHSWLLYQKLQDGDRLIINKAEWKHICEEVAGLQSDLESPEFRPLEPASDWQISIFTIWIVAVVVAMVLAYARIGPLGLLIWAIGPIPYLLWYGWKARHQGKPDGPSFLAQSDYPRFREVQQSMAFVPFDVERFKPTRTYLRQRRKEIALTAMPAAILIIAGWALWPTSVYSNLHRQGNETSGI